ncbi:Holliday junction branch migration DNA helicase RuvB [Mycoplasma leonicaptivi]|uniref:Holliday junction branch migration DNA helicase RuvB n=1 Tax=Mycoplasma leonicaptivi TaxID=36742 RepID=UPI00055A28A1|nr:Holliday junction branch migration DNA helicase RuvB [Mycoplasma leonicaptivi]
MNQSSQLRPISFDDFIGQKTLKNTLRSMINSAKHQNKQMPHILLYGLPGMGKTTLASLIAYEMGSDIHFVQGANLEKKSDIINMLSIIKEGDIIFVDEIHSINKQIVEFLYNAMEDFVFDLIVGAEGNSKSVRMKIKPFTLIGATTKLNEIAQPFKDRFGYLARLSNYTEQELSEIINNSSKKLNINIEDKYINIISLYSRKTPRIANHLLQRINDFAISENNGVINNKILKITFKNLGLFEYGLTRDHIEYLEILKEGFEDKYVSLLTISGILSQTKENILSEIEPILQYFKLIEKSSKGRRISSKGIDYLLRQNFQSFK